MPLASEKALTVHTVMPPFRARELFRRLSPEGKQKWAGILVEHDFPANSIVYECGRRPARVWILRSGRASLSDPECQIEAGAVRSIGLNEVCGLTETIGRLPYGDTLRTVTPCRFDSIGYPELAKLIRKEPAFGTSLLSAMARNFHQSYKRLLTSI